MTRAVRTIVAAIAAFIGGDCTAVAELWEHFEPSVLAVVSAELRTDGAEVRDVTTTALIDAFGSCPRDWHSNPETDEARFGKWLRSVARNRCQEYFRDRDKWRSLGHLTSETSIPDPRPSPDDVLEGKEIQERVRSAVALLDPTYREAVHLRYFEGLSSPVVAERLSTTPGAVRTRLHEGRRLLRSHLLIVA
jgi:RNA polymerase sigma-70 factor (ECF subfamily)